MQGNQTSTGENLNGTSNELETTMPETSEGICSNPSNTGKETLEGARTIEQGSSLDGNYSMDGSNSNDFSGSTVNNLNPANTGAGASNCRNAATAKKGKKN